MTDSLKLNTVVPSVLRRIRVRKQDSAYVYAILESHGGTVSFSTVDYEKGAAFRDLELSSSLEFEADVDKLIQQMNIETEEGIYELKR